MDFEVYFLLYLMVRFLRQSIIRHFRNRYFDTTEKVDWVRNLFGAVSKNRAAFLWGLARWGPVLVK